mmetsp:Transcript_46496/g.104511  ORF Transcript_46496/g.104511 Transcript_46496/m.104511 type:complete len:148 (-) Transcript_46496:40-483(-)
MVIKVLKRPAARLQKKPARAPVAGGSPPPAEEAHDWEDLLEDLAPTTEGRIVVLYHVVQEDEDEDELMAIPCDDELTREGEATYEMRLPDGWELQGEMGPGQLRSSIFVGPPELVFEARNTVSDLYGRYVQFGCVSSFEIKVDIRPI